MIPILFEADETNFTSNGLGLLADAVSCVVTEERNGQYELEMQYPACGRRYADLSEERLIWAAPADGADAQPFRIYSISRPLDGVVTVNAQHISYDLKKMVVLPYAAASASEAMRMIGANIAGECPFTFWTDLQTAADQVQTVPVECRALLGGITGSVLDVYGGEYEFDRFAVKLYAERGMDAGVTIRYGKNLTGLQAVVDDRDVYTSAIPYWTQNDVTVIGDRAECEHAGDYAGQKCTALDLSADFDEQPTKKQLTAAAREHMEQNKTWAPKVDLDVSFVPLWQTEEYARIAPIEHVRLCDTLSVECESLGITAKVKVIRTEYDVLLDRYNSLGLGDARVTFAEAVDRNTLTAADLNRSESALRRDIENARVSYDCGSGTCDRDGLYQIALQDNDARRRWFLTDTSGDGPLWVEVTGTNVIVHGSPDQTFDWICMAEKEN